MDVALEVADTFLLDRVYAHLLPLSAAPGSFDPIHSLAASLKGYGDSTSNASWASQAAAAHAPASNGWMYTPATQYFSFQPGQDAYLSQWDRGNIYRQTISLYAITWLLGLVIYFFFATLSYVFVFDKATFQHPKYLKNQIRMEIRQTMESVPVMAIFTTLFFVAEVRGHSYMYDSAVNPGFSHSLLNFFGPYYNYLQYPFFLLFTDFCIYWIHRGLHHPLVYKRLHKPHHKWIMPTPFASIAFHPLDGFSQSIPYHAFPFLFPLGKGAYLGLFAFIQIWTVMIHDGEYVANSAVINGAACHTMHHLYFNYNYGQYTTLWDRLGGSYRKPNEELFVKETKMSQDEWKRQTKEMEKMVVEVEGVDDRTYGPVPGTEGKKMQ